MKYRHCVQYVMSTPWAILPTKLMELLSVLSVRASGGELTAEEIAARIGDPKSSAASQNRGAVAVIPIYGVLAHRMGTLEESSGGMSTERIGRMFDQAMSDPGIGSIVFDVDSPGGTVPGVQELASKIAAKRGAKPMLAVANSLMASAAYWIASQADEIIGIPSSTIGSIGVFAAHEDLSKALELDGISVTLISAGTYKTEGNPFEPLSAEAKGILQARVDDAYQSFVADVARGRKTTPAKVAAGYGQGRAVSAPDAVSAGLIDRIATFDEVIVRLTGSTARMQAEATGPSLDARRRRLAMI